eukprot:gene6251-6970_t
MKEIGVQTKITKFRNRSAQTEEPQTASKAVITVAVEMSSTATSTIDVASATSEAQTDDIIKKDIGISTENLATSIDKEDEDIFFPCVEEILIFEAWQM